MEEFKLNPVKEIDSKIAENFQSGFDKVFSSANKKNNPNKLQAGMQPSASNALDKGVNQEPVKPAKEEPKITEAEITASHKKGYEEGYSKGFSDAKNAADDVNKQINDTVKNIDVQLKQILEQRKFEDLKKSEDVINLALRVARKVSDKCISDNACQIVENVIVRSFEILFDEPRILICVNSKIIEDIKKRIDNLINSEGFAAEVEVIASDSINIGSCKIQWQGGGLITDHEAVWNDIETMLQ